VLPAYCVLAALVVTCHPPLCDTTYLINAPQLKPLLLLAVDLNSIAFPVTNS